MRGRKLNWFVFLVAGAVVASLLSRKFQENPAAKTIIFDNGVQLSLHKVTFGTRHSVICSNLPRRTLEFDRESLVVWLVGVFPINSHVVWEPAPVFSSGRGMHPAPVDGDGKLRAYPEIPWRVIGPGGAFQHGVIDIMGPASTTAQLIPLVLHSFPRRQAELVLQFYHPSDAGVEDLLGGSLAGEFRIANPKVSRSPAWQAQPLPAPADNGGVSCRLIEFSVLQTGTNRSEALWTPRGAPSGSVSHQSRVPDLSMFPKVKAVFDMLENGIPSPAWRIVNMTITDPTGNRGFSNQLSLATTLHPTTATPSASVGTDIFETWGVLESPCWFVTRDGQPAFLSTERNFNRITALTSPLWFDEPAWRIQVQMQRTGHYPAEHVVRLAELPFPPEAGTDAVILTTNLYGSACVIRAVGGHDWSVPNQPPPAGDHRWMYPSLRFEFQDTPQVLHTPVVVRARGNTGLDLHPKSLELLPPTRFAKSAWRLHFPEFNPRSMKFFKMTNAAGISPPGPKYHLITSITLELAEQEIRMFEFTAQPDKPAPAGQPPPN